MTNKQIGVDLEFIFPGKITNLALPIDPGDAASKEYVDDAIDGVSGINAFTTTTASFLVPAVNSNVTVAVAESRWMVVGQVLFTEFGSFRVQSIFGETSISLTNLTGTQGASIASGTKLSPSGERGIQGNPGGLGSAASYSINAIGIAGGATVEQSLPLPKSMLIYRIISNSSIRIRQYFNADYRMADIARSSSTAIQGDHGCYYDVITKAERGFIRNLSPPPIAISSGTGFFLVSNLETISRNINIEIIGLTLEA